MQMMKNLQNSGINIQDTKKNAQTGLKFWWKRPKYFLKEEKGHKKMP